MTEWWDQLSTISKFFYYVAIPSTTVLFIQSILTMIGFGMSADADMDFDTDMDADFDVDMDVDFEPEMALDGDMDGGFNLDLNGDGLDEFEVIAGVADFRFVTFRGIIAFLTMFGWVGAALANAGAHVAIVLILALIAGLTSMFIIAMMFYGISKLQSSGNISYRNAIGRAATIYIPVPPNKNGFGKIQMTLQERLVEVNAVTESDTMIGTGEAVRVIDMLNATTVVVERLK